MQPIAMRSPLIVLLLTVVHVHSALIKFENDTHGSVFASCIVRIISDLHKIQLKTLHFIQCEAKQDDVIDGVVNQISPSLTYTIEDIEHISEWYPRWFNIILINGENEFSSFVKKLNESYFDPRGFYIIAVETVLNAEDRENLSRTVFRTFFSLFYDNVIALFTDEAGTIVYMYTFLPCDGTHACYEVVPVLHNTFDGKQFLKNIRHFPQKWKNFNGCSVPIAVSSNPPYISVADTVKGETKILGVDAKILEKIASHLNFTIDYKPSRVKNFIYENGTATGAFETIRNGKASLTVGGYYASKSRLKYFSASLPYLQTEIVYALPVSLEIGSLERHLIPLKKEIWIVYFSIHCGAFIFLSILKVFGSKLYIFVVGDHSRSPFLDMFQIFFGVSFHRTPRYTFARSLFAIWLLSTFIISSGYRGRLVEILTSRSPKSIPRTIKALDEMKYEIFIRPDMEGYMKLLYGNDKRIKVIDRVTHKFLELQIPSGRRRAVVETVILVNHFNAHHYRNGVVPILPERLLCITGSMLFKKNSYLVPSFNQALRHFINSGLINKWIQEVVNTSFVNDLRETTGPKTLNLSHFEGTFQLCAMVMGIAILMFVIELISLRWCMLRRIVQFYTE